VEEFLSKDYPPISALVLNAGYRMCATVEFLADGLELMFAIHHLNHALLFFLLQPHLTDTARIILVSSSTHDPKFRRVPTPPNSTTGDPAAHPPIGKKYETYAEGNRRYALSKLCNVLVTYTLHDRQTRDRVVMALDPGVMATKLYRWVPGLSGKVLNRFFASSIGRGVIRDLYKTDYVAGTLAKMAVDRRSGEGEGRETPIQSHTHLREPKVPSSELVVKLTEGHILFMKSSRVRTVRSSTV